MVHTNSYAKKETGDACDAPHASACAPCSQSLRCTTPTARHTGQLTSTNPPARSRSPSLSGPHPATRSALTRHAGWNVCPHTDAPSPSERIRQLAQGPLSAPGRRLMDQVRKTCHHSAAPSRVHLARPVGAASSRVEAAVPMVVLARPGPGGACGAVAVRGCGWRETHLMARTRTMTHLASGQTEGSWNWNRPGNARHAIRVLLAVFWWWLHTLTWQRRLCLRLDLRRGGALLYRTAVW
jgi:hypothetical protein